jgi:hypothetical protein
LQKIEHLLQKRRIFQLENPNKFEQEVKRGQHRVTTFTYLAVANNLEGSSSIVCHLPNDEWIKTCQIIKSRGTPGYRQTRAAITFVHRRRLHSSGDFNKVLTVYNVRVWFGNQPLKTRFR